MSRTGTVGLTEHLVTVPKCLHKIPKFIKNSVKVHQNPLKTDEKFMFCFVDNGSKTVRSKKTAKHLIKSLGRFNLPLKSAADTDSDC